MVTDVDSKIRPPQVCDMVPPSMEGHASPSPTSLVSDGVRKL